MKNKQPNEDVEVAVFPRESGQAYAAADRRKIQRLVRENVLSKSKETYHKAQVAVSHDPDGSPNALTVTLLRANTYTADVVTVKVDRDYNMKSVEPAKF